MPAALEHAGRSAMRQVYVSIHAWDTYGWPVSVFKACPVRWESYYGRCGSGKHNRVECLLSKRGYPLMVGTTNIALWT